MVGKEGRLNVGEKGKDEGIRVGKKGEVKG
jgi:hypothetical protein